MKIGIYNLESQYINIALEKVKIYHINKGDIIEDYLQLWHHTYDKIYASSIFDFTNKQYITDDMEIGGTGFLDLIHKQLPIEIDAMKPKLNVGFTIRGCFRKCEFCLVPEKEGKLNVIGDLYDLWDGKGKKIVLYDNNILGNPKHFKTICEQAQKENLEIDFNQGLDVRILTEEQCQILKNTKITRYRFAFDHISLKPKVVEKCKMLNKYKIGALWYVLVGFDSTIEEDIERVNILVKYKQRAFIQRHKNCGDDKRYICIARWANSPGMGMGTIPFKEYLMTNEGNNYRKYFKD